MTVWYVRKSGAINNGGTSPTVRSTGSDGISNTTAGLQYLSSITAAWTAADIGHGVCVATSPGSAGIFRLVSAVTDQTTKTVTTSSGSTTVTSAAQFDASMVGQIITGPGVAVNTVVTVFTNASSITISNAAGAGFGTGTATFYVKLTTTGTTNFANQTGQTWNVGGAVGTVARAIDTNSCVQRAGAAGDSVYVGAGVYRETVAVAKSGSAGNPISVVGDVDGAVTGDPGEVIFTNYLVDYNTLPAATALLALGAMTYLTFQALSLVAGNANVVTDTANGHHISFIDCTLLSATTTAIALTGSTAGQPKALLVDRCSVLSLGHCVSHTSPTFAGTGDFDHGSLIRDSLLISIGSNCVTVTTSGSATQSRGGGIRVIGSTLWAAANCMSATTTLTTSIVIPCEVRGCILLSGSTALVGIVAGQCLIEDHNLFFAVTARSNVAVGPSSISNGSYAPLFDLGQAYKVSGIARPFLSPSSPLSPLLAFGQFMQNTGGPPSAFLDQRGQQIPGTPGWRPPGLLIAEVMQKLGAKIAAPTYDWANRPRPAGTGSNLQTVGYLEYHDSATKDATTYDGSPASAKLVGPGDIDLLVPVDAGSQTISIRCLYDTAYNGQQFPTLSLLANGEIGVTAQTVAAAGGAWGTWQTITLAAINPTAAGIVKVRLTSRDGGGTSQVNFDTFAIV